MTNAQFVIPEELELRYIIVERERERAGTENAFCLYRKPLNVDTTDQQSS
jgi:hypothetical protein